MAEKTREQLRQEIRSLQLELEERRKEDAFNEPIEQIGKMRRKLVEEGFTEDQAYELVLTMIRAQGR